jgi:hypothetical protein
MPSRFISRTTDSPKAVRPWCTGGWLLESAHAVCLSCVELVEHPQDGQRRVDAVAAFHPDERRDPAAPLNPLDLFRRAGELERGRILRHEPMDDVDLLERGGGCISALPRRGDVDRPELPADAACPKAGDVGHEGWLGAQEIQGRRIATGFLPQGMRQVVVAVEDRRLAQQPPRAVEQRIVLARGARDGERQGAGTRDREEEHPSHGPIIPAAPNSDSSRRI